MPLAGAPRAPALCAQLNEGWLRTQPDVSVWAWLGGSRFSAEVSCFLPSREKEGAQSVGWCWSLGLWDGVKESLKAFLTDGKGVRGPQFPPQAAPC